MTDPGEPPGSTKLPTLINIPPQEEGPSTSSEGQIDLGVIIQKVDRSWDRLISVVQKMPDDKKKQYLSNHFEPYPRDTLYSHSVTKNGKTWNVSFQLRWLEQFPWLSYSSVVSGGICRYCILFPKQPGRGEGLGRSTKLGVLILSLTKGLTPKPLERMVFLFATIIL